MTSEHLIPACPECGAAHYPAQSCRACPTCHGRHHVSKYPGVCEEFAETLYKQALGQGHQGALRAVYIAGYRDASGLERGELEELREQLNSAHARIAFADATGRQV